MKTVITFGTFDVFHLGHLKLLLRAKTYGDHLVVGVSTDQLNFEKKGHYPIYSESERQQIVAAMRCVDQTFMEEALELKEQYIKQFSADVLVMGDDWRGKFDGCKTLCEVVYLERTPAISTTAVIEKIRA